MQALRDDVIVRPIYTEHKGLIEIPKTALEYKQYAGGVFGEVVSVGQKFSQTFGGEKLENGENIIFTRHEGKRFTHEGIKYLKLSAKWVLAKVNL